MSQSTPRHDARFESPEKGIERLEQLRNNWTDALGKRSIEACYAIIGASWAVFGKGALNNRLVVMALCLLLVHIGASLFVVWLVGELAARRFRFAQANPKKWHDEWAHSAEPSSPWPYTKGIEAIGKWYQRAKALIPIIAALLFIIALVTSSSSIESSVNRSP